MGLERLTTNCRDVGELAESIFDNLIFSGQLSAFGCQRVKCNKPDASAFRLILLKGNAPYLAIGHQHHSRAMLAISFEWKFRQISRLASKLAIASALEVA